jgi:probable F420-dependent oxidoreductase
VIREYVQEIEAMGYDYLLGYDHILGANPDRPGGWRGPYTHRERFHELFVLFGYLAAITTRLEFVSGILILPQRETALVAKQAAQVDVLSGGRLRLGIGIGWNPVEYEAQGFDFTNRGVRSEEQVEVLRALWTQPLVTFKGQYHTISDAGLNPLPVQRPIPIWFGGGADVVLERMARLGDGWIANTMTVEQAQQTVAVLHRYLEAAGRNPSEFGIDFRVNINTQPVEEWLDYVEGWEKLGATHVAINSMNAGLRMPDEHLRMLRLFMERIGNR